MNNNMNNMDISALMNMLSKMDKKDLEEGFAKVSKVLGSKDKEDLMKKFNNLK